MQQQIWQQHSRKCSLLEQQAPAATHLGPGVAPVDGAGGQTSCCQLSSIHLLHAMRRRDVLVDTNNQASPPSVLGQHSTPTASTGDMPLAHLNNRQSCRAGSQIQSSDAFGRRRSW